MNTIDELDCELTRAWSIAGTVAKPADWDERTKNKWYSPNRHWHVLAPTMEEAMARVRAKVPNIVFTSINHGGQVHLV
jgi:hypothetical protein